MSSRAARMVEMALNNQNENKLIDSRSDTIGLGDNLSNLSGPDSDDEVLSKFVNKMKYADKNHGTDLEKFSQLSSEAAPSRGLAESYSPLQCSIKQAIEKEEQLVLFEVPNNVAFSLPPSILNEMKTQNIITDLSCSGEEIEYSLSIPDENIILDLVLPPAENAAETDSGVLLLVNNEDQTTLEKEVEIENEISLHNAEMNASEVPKSNKKRRGVSERVKTKVRRLHGENYTGYSRSKDGRIQHNKSRDQRTMKSRCVHKTPEKQTSRTLLCGEVSEEARKAVFQYFWNLPSWSARKCYLKGFVSTTNIRRRRKNTHKDENRKNQSHDCFLPVDTGTKVLVCRTMLLNTFDLGRDTFQRWTTNSQCNEKPTNFEKDDENDMNISNNGGSECTSKKMSKAMKQQAWQWLNDLPKVPSHYCRSSSKKLYIESIFRSTLHVYKVYSNFCVENKTKPISRTSFRKILKTENIAIHKPRKDQCDLCCSWKTGNIPEDLYNRHVRKKNEAEVAKREAKESLSNEKLVVTMDLQSVLLAPKLEASAVYYKQKLQIHNFTVYALNNKQVDLYVWHESNGGVTSNEFTSCIVNYIETAHREKKYKHVVLISDGCGYQNRNKVLSSGLLKLSEDMNITIEQLILERGHTMMEVDSIHSSLEAYFKPPIYAPSDYVTRMRQARDQQPYHVHNLHFSFFRNYENVTGNLTSIKPGRDAKVTDIRGLLYLPTGVMKYKLNHSDEWVEFVKPRNKTKASESKQLSRVPEQLHHSPIKISKQKYDHLQELKKVMESDYHPFYDSLPHN